MKSKITVLFMGLLLALGLALVNPSSASAAQGGLQQINVKTTSWSAVWTDFNCGQYNVPVGQTWGEGWGNPLCGGVSTGDREPKLIWIGAGWCVTRNVVYHDSGQVTADGYAWGGGSGAWAQIWSSVAQVNSPGGYTSSVASWYGGWCPTSGASAHDGNWIT